MNADRSIPRATYRLQLNREFTFAHATEIVPYLAALGISHCYISPCLKARPGSLHGYDIVDHNSLNPEIGTPEEFDRFVETLHQHKMGLILDIVPNHMGVMGSDNAWWLDVLENGEASIYACFFDIDWRPLKEELHGKVLVPVLGDHYGTVLESGELKLTFRAQSGEFDICYRNHRFPVNPREYPRILQKAADLSPPKEQESQGFIEFQSLITAFGHLPARQHVSSESIAERNRDKEIHKRRLAELCARSPEISMRIAQTVESINGSPANPASFNELHELIKTQAFRLANWRVAADDINYRRFFDTNDLAGICVENENVFEATHKMIVGFIAEGKVDGLRVDHPDGLYDPAQYFERLKHSIATAVAGTEQDTELYVVIEKILTGAEPLPKEWPVCGTTGYDFANLVNGLFVDRASSRRFEHTYQNFIDDDTGFNDVAYYCRRLTTRNLLASELNVLANQLSQIALSKRHTCDFTLNNLRDALTEVVANFPVYRTYVTPSEVSDNDLQNIGLAVAAAKWRSPATDTSVFDFVGEVLSTRIAEGQDAAYRKAVTTFAMKFQQFSSPVMAKGLEDTAFYHYNRLVSLNEVGSDLHRFGVSVDEFHEANQSRLRDWPHSMLATSTHDSKRSEDVRARINVLSEVHGLWRVRLREWKRINRNQKRKIADKPAPSANDEYLLYQTLIGAWPIQPLRGESEWQAFRERIERYMLKAVREAKQNTSWINRNAEYEDAVISFVRALLTPGENRFLDNFLPFQQRIARIGLWNSLSQTLLKLTSPGVPDIYQGNELSDFSLVDPDNRHSVDYRLRQDLLKSLQSQTADFGESLASQLLESPEDGRLKLYLIWKALCLRQWHADVFSHGSYEPLEVEGAHSEHVVAFTRSAGNSRVLVVVPRLISSLINEKPIPPVGSEIWADTRIVMPCDSAAVPYRNPLTGAALHSENNTIWVGQLLSTFPLALCSQE